MKTSLLNFREYLAEPFHLTNIDFSCDVGDIDVKFLPTRGRGISTRYIVDFLPLSRNQLDDYWNLFNFQLQIS